MMNSRPCCFWTMWTTLLFGVGVAFSSWAALPVAAADRPPNIIFILADDLGQGELGCYGQKVIQTPHIDRLAREGMRFTQAYCGNAVCAPSRCCLMTGKHPGHAYIRDNGNPPDRVQRQKSEPDFFAGQHPIPDSEVTIAEVLKQKNYATGAAGKWGLGYEGSTGDPNRQGFDLFYGYYCQAHAHNHFPKYLWRNGRQEKLPGNDGTRTGQTFSQDKFTDVALQFIRDQRDRPFCLYLPFTITHLSLQVPDESLAQYQGKIPEAEYNHRDNYFPHPHPRAAYAAMVSHMDRAIGQVMSLVSELGLDEQTLVMFSSDNGPTYDRLGGTDSAFFHSALNFRGYKGSLYEGGIRTPLVARWPGKIAAGAVTDHVCAFWDVLPTLAEITGTRLPDGIDGISFAPTLLGQPDRQQSHEFLYWEFPAYGGQQAVRLGNWKGVRQNMQRPAKAKSAAKTAAARDPLQIELYDLQTDEGEAHDVAAEHAEIVERIVTIMRQSHSPSDLFPLAPLDGPPRK